MLAAVSSAQTFEGTAQYTFWNPTTNAAVSSPAASDEAVVSLSTISPYGLVGQNLGSPPSILFTYNGQYFGFQNAAEYSVNGKNAGAVPRAFPYVTGYHTFSAYYCSRVNGQSCGGTPLTTHLTIQNGSPAITFSTAGTNALGTLEAFFDGSVQVNGTSGWGWNLCKPRANDANCLAQNLDWGADNLTFAMYFRWMLNTDPTERALIASILGRISNNSQDYRTPPANFWSDVPLWDSVAGYRMYQVLQNAPGTDPNTVSKSLAKAHAAFDYVDNDLAHEVGGACAPLLYQLPSDSSGLGGWNKLKTMESDTNYVKAALLRFQITGDSNYLTKARDRYLAIRTYMMDSNNLYSVYMTDQNSICTVFPGRYFASVNGNMIWAGVALAAAYNSVTYFRQAAATGTAVVTKLSDPTGIFVNNQAENDVSEPLIEGMYALATAPAITGVSAPQGFARSWLLTNAYSSIANVIPGTGSDKNTSAGAYSRFFGAPLTSPQAIPTAFQSSGGIALAFAAAALAPSTGPTGAPPTWTYVAKEINLNKNSLSAAWTDVANSIGFTGRAIALIGTVGEWSGNSMYNGENGHAKVILDSTEMNDKTGIWQAKGLPWSTGGGSSGQPLTNRYQEPNSVLFAWHWTKPSGHTVSFLPGDSNVKEGDPFVHITGYYYLP